MAFFIIALKDEFYLQKIMKKFLKLCFHLSYNLLSADYKCRTHFILTRFYHAENINVQNSNFYNSDKINVI